MEQTRTSLITPSSKTKSKAGNPIQGTMPPQLHWDVGSWLTLPDNSAIVTYVTRVNHAKCNGYMRLSSKC